MAGGDGVTGTGACDGQGMTATATDNSMHRGLHARPVSAFDVVLCRGASASWLDTPIRQRLTVLRRWRHAIAQQPKPLAQLLADDKQRPAVEVLASELLPLLDACRFLETHARRLLKPRGACGRSPAWLTGNRVVEQRDPLGVVLIVGADNYPLQLPGIQALQALAAGNGVLLKPAARGVRACQYMADQFRTAGLPEGLLQVSDAETAHVHSALAASVDHVVLTGSATTGRTVHDAAVRQGATATMELSGSDAVFVCADADVELAARAVAFGLRMNDGRTCIGPRRLFVHESVFAAFREALVRELREAAEVPVAPATTSAIGEVMGLMDVRSDNVLAGRLERDRMTPMLVEATAAAMRRFEADVFAPFAAMAAVSSMDEAVELDRHCPFALGAAVFTSEAAGRALASRIDAGLVIVNDAIVPLSDPRVALAPRHRSGYGVTRGEAGLLAMTRLKVVCRRSGRWRPHYDPMSPQDREIFEHYLRAAHGRGAGNRVRSAFRLFAGLAKRGKGETGATT